MHLGVDPLKHVGSLIIFSKLKLTNTSWSLLSWGVKLKSPKSNKLSYVLDNSFSVVESLFVKKVVDVLEKRVEDTEGVAVVEGVTKLVQLDEEEHQQRTAVAVLRVF